MATSKTEQARLATLSPVEYVREQNAETRAWVAEDPENRGAMCLVEDADHWAHCANGLEVAMQLACASYSDWYKELNGIRPRWARFATLDEVEAALEELAEDSERRRAWEAELEKELEAERAREAHAAYVEALIAPETGWMDRAAAAGAAGW